MASSRSVEEVDDKLITVWIMTSKYDFVRTHDVIGLWYIHRVCMCVCVGVCVCVCVCVGVCVCVYIGV